VTIEEVKTLADMKFIDNGCLTARNSNKKKSCCLWGFRNLQTTWPTSLGLVTLRGGRGGGGVEATRDAGIRRENEEEAIRGYLLR
jgi:hypothetical protein